MVYFERKQSIFIVTYSIERPKKTLLRDEDTSITQLYRSFCQFRTRSHDMSLKPRGEIRPQGCGDHLGFMFIRWFSIDPQSTLKNLKLRKYFRQNKAHDTQATKKNPHLREGVFKTSEITITTSLLGRMERKKKLFLKCKWLII